MPVAGQIGAERFASENLARFVLQTLEEVPFAPTAFRDGISHSPDPGPEMIWLPGGTFRMGSPEGVGNDDERPAHDVTLSHFAAGKYPLTVGEFRRFAEATGYKTEAEGGDGTAPRPPRKKEVAR